MFILPKSTAKSLESSRLNYLFETTVRDYLEAIECKQRESSQCEAGMKICFVETDQEACLSLDCCDMLQLLPETTKKSTRPGRRYLGEDDHAVEI